MSQEKENQEKKRGFVFDKIDLIALLSSYSGDQQEMIMGKVEALEHQINNKIEIAQKNNPNFSEEDKKEIAINLLKQDGSDVSRSLLELVFNFVSDKNQEDQNKVEEKDEESVRTLEEKLGFVRYGIFLNLREKLYETKDETKLVFTQEEMEALEKMIWESKLVVLLRTKIEKDEFQGKTDEDMKKIIRETIDPITEKLVNDLKEEKRKKIEAKKILPKKKELTDEESLKKVREEIEKAMRFHLDEINGPKSEAFISGATADPVLDIGNFKFNPNIKSAVLELIEKANFRIREALDEKRMNLRESERINKEITNLFVEYKNAYFWEKLNKLRDYFSNQENGEAKNAFEKIAELNEWIVDFQKAGMDGFRKYTKEDVDLLKKTLAELNEAVSSLENLKETSPEVNLTENKIGEDNLILPEDEISLSEEELSEEELFEKLDVSRNFYAKINHKSNKASSRIKKVLGIFHKTKSENLPDVQLAYGEYREALNQLLNRKIENLKKSGLTQEELKKEMGDLMKYFNQDERIRLYEAYTEARTDEVAKNGGIDGGAIGAIEIFFGQYITWRKKQKIWVNVGIGLTLSAVGLGVVNRVSGALISGVGATHLSEAAFRKGVETLDKIKNKKALTLIENEQDTNKFDFLKEYIEKDISQLDKKLRNEKIANIGSLAVGAGAGFLVGSGVASDMMKAGFEWIRETEISQWVMEKASEKFAPAILETKNAVHNLAEKTMSFFSEKPVDSGGLQNQGGALNKVTNPMPPMPDTDKADVTIEKGSSITETLQDSGVKSDEAYRKVLDYAEKSGIDPKDLDLVYPGQEIELNPDGSIKNISDVNDAVGYPETVDNETVPSETDAVNQTSEVSASKVEPLEIKKGDNLSKVLGQQGIGDSQIQSMLSDYAKSKGIEIGSLDRIYPGQQIVLSPDGKSIESILESHDSYMMKTIQGIGNNSEWKSVKNLSFDQIENPKINKNLSGIMEKYHDLLGDKANPKNGETMREWVARMAKLSMQNSRKEFFI